MSRRTNTNAQGPVVEFPWPEGERYEAVVPDTLDLAERAELALNGLGGTIHPELYHEPYAYVFYGYKTPVMRHDGCALTCAPKYAESFPLLRMMCGSDRYAEFARTLGLARIGWLSLVTSHAVTESCVQADLVALGVRLSDLGLGDYWDDVDAVVRNAFIEQQVTRADLLEKVAAASLAHFEDVTDPKYRHPNQICEENVIERTLGAFFSWPGVTSVERPWVLLCCTGNGTQGLYYAWEGALRRESGTVLVNLLLNRASPWADVDSYLPYQGRVVVRNKSAKRIGLRIPAWVDRKQVRAAVNGAPADGEWIGNRLFFEVRPQDEVTLQFPVPETTARYTVMSKVWKLEATYTCTFRGSTLMDISPRDQAATSYPLYLRGHLRQDQAPMKRVNRFAASKIMRNW